LAEKIIAGEVKSITVNGDDLKITLTDGSKVISRKESESGLTDTLKNYGVDPQVLRSIALSITEPSSFKLWFGILLQAILPIIVMVLIFWWIFRQAGRGVNQAFSFGKVNLRLFTPSRDRVTFKDVAGLK